MIFISLLILIGQIAFSSVKNNQGSTSGFSPILFSRITAIIFLYTGALIINAFYIQTIGSGIGIFGGLFYVTSITQLFELLFIFVALLILPCFSPNNTILSNNNSNNKLTTDKSMPSIPFWGNGKMYLKTIIINIPFTSILRTKAGGEILFPWFLPKPGVNPQSDFENLNLNTSIHTARVKEYSLIILFSSLGSILLLSSFDLISMYLSIELQSFGLYILSIVYQQNKESTNAGLKYFLLGGLSSCIILLGSAIIYSFLGITNLESIYILLSTTSPFLQEGLTIGGFGGLNLGLILIIIGLLFKLAAAPLHNWAPDVYAESPTKVTIWLTILPKISILNILLEILSHIPLSSYLIYQPFSLGLDLQIKNLLLISSLLSLLIGTIVGLSQIKIKRLLAYSTISHIGFILLALAIKSQSSIESLIFYIIQYSITNMNTFLILIALGYITHSHLLIAQLTFPMPSLQVKGMETERAENLEKNNTYSHGILREEVDITFISELKNQFFSNPLLSLSLITCLFSMAGIPPLIGFFSKQFVLFSAVDTGYYYITFVAIITSVISAYYYLSLIITIASDYQTNTKNPSILPPIISPTVNFGKQDLTKLLILQGIGEKFKPVPQTRSIDVEHGKNIILNYYHSYIISILTFIIIFFILKSSIILNSCRILSLTIYFT